MESGEKKVVRFYMDGVEVFACEALLEDVPRENAPIILGEYLRGTAIGTTASAGVGKVTNAGEEYHVHLEWLIAQPSGGMPGRAVRIVASKPLPQ